MWQILKRNPLAAVIAILMHLAIVLFMVVGFDWLKKPEQPRSNVEVVQAQIVDQSKVFEEVKRLQDEEQKQAQAQADRERKETQRLAELKRKQEAEKQRLAELEKQRKAEEAKRQAALEAEKRRQAEAEKQRRAEEVKRKAAAEAEAKQKAEAEKQRKAEEAKRIAEEKRRKAEEAKRKAAAEAEAKRKAELERKRQAEEAARKAREAEAQAALEAERNARELDRYTTQIKQKVNRSWVRPAGIGEGLACTLRVRLAPGGAVLAVSLVKSSGNDAFDRSASAAVYKADPLPVPGGILFESFRDFDFEFKPN